MAAECFNTRRPEPTAVQQFRRPFQKSLRAIKNKRGQRLFSAEEIHELLKNGSAHVRAFTLLGINCGLGNTDIAEMEPRHIDLKTGWLKYARPKTEVNRKAKLWPETVEAVELAITEQKSHRTGLVFVTRFRKPWTLLNRTSLWKEESSCIAVRKKS